MRNGLRKILFSFLILVLLLFCVMLIRTLTVRSKQIKEKWLGTSPLNDSAFQRLAQAVRFRTISYDDSSDGYLKMLELQRPQSRKNQSRLVLSRPQRCGLWT